MNKTLVSTVALGLVMAFASTEVRAHKGNEWFNNHPNVKNCLVGVAIGGPAAITAGGLCLLSLAMGESDFVKSCMIGACIGCISGALVKRFPTEYCVAIATIGGAFVLKRVITR